MLNEHGQRFGATREACGERTGAHHVTHLIRHAEQSGVTIIDTDTLKPVISIATGPGHHEIAFSDDSRHAFVTNRDAGTVSVVEVRELKVVHEVKTGGKPIQWVARSANTTPEPKRCNSSAKMMRW